MKVRLQQHLEEYRICKFVPSGGEGGHGGPPPDRDPPLFPGMLLKMKESDWGERAHQQ
jgi:hypothetical protein